MINSNSISKYKHFIIHYILPLIGISYNNNLENSDVISKEMIWQNNNCLYFSTQDTALGKIKLATNIPADTLRLSRSVLLSFLSIAPYRIKNGSSKVKYVSNSLEAINYRAAVQRGIVSWVIGNQNMTELETLFDLLQEWSVKTYEGKKVTLGFVINPNASSCFGDKYGNWLKFMSEDIAAVFTDCIDSIIELDSKCNFCRYLSPVDNNSVSCAVARTNYSAPIRFATVIENYIVDKKIGIFLLNNGDIILSKNKKIVLVKRNLKWLNFSYDAFNNAIITYLPYTITESLKQSIYASMLDVSFSHSGGIISVVKDSQLLTKTAKDGEPILSETDNLQNNIPYEMMITNIEERNDKFEAENKKHLTISRQDIKTRLLKRKVIDSLVNNSSFENINRQLRSELISLDGACIINTIGDVISFGAIIKNDSGSSGGGRGAAAKKLSRFGLAIKISTDGYIELYIDGDLKYSIK